MTRRDYEAMAGYLRDLKPTTGGYTIRRWHEFVEYLTERFAADNKRFNRERFRNACAYGERYEEDTLRRDIVNYHNGDGDETGGK
jgi:hypothetical protein